MSKEDDCKKGNHVPVAMTDKHHRIIEVVCQECMKPMTKEEHRKFFESKPWHPVNGKINYDDPGDPKDVDVYMDTDEW